MYITIVIKRNSIILFIQAAKFLSIMSLNIKKYEIRRVLKCKKKIKKIYILKHTVYLNCNTYYKCKYYYRTYYYISVLFYFYVVVISDI